MLVALERTSNWNLGESRLVEAEYMGFFVDDSSCWLWLHRTKTNEPTNYFFVFSCKHMEFANMKQKRSSE